MKLTPGEAEALIDALMPCHHSPSLLSTTDLGLVAERIELSSHARWNGRVLGETRMRTQSGASVVAVLRRAVAIPSPAPDFRLPGGDVLIVIGTREGVEAAAEILGRGRAEAGPRGRHTVMFFTEPLRSFERASAHFWRLFVVRSGRRCERGDMTWVETSTP